MRRSRPKRRDSSRKHPAVRRSVVSFVVVMSMMLTGVATAADAPSSMQDGEASPGPLLHNSHAPCQGGETVAVIHDSVAWSAPDDPRGNVVTELIAQMKNWCAIHSVDLATADLSPFGEIIIPSAQNKTFYDRLFPGGIIDPNLEAWVLSGGVLSANLADHATGPGAGGNWDGDTFVGGVQHRVVASDDVNIFDASHPIITGAVPCPSGNCGPIVDQGQYTDLDGWSFSTHGFFTNVPAAATIILVDEGNRPVMIEYPHGSGVVIATLSTSEYMYAGNFGSSPRNRKLLANEIAYQDSLRMTAVDIDIKPHSFPNSIKTRSRGRIPVAILSSPTFDATTEIDKNTPTFGKSGDEPSLAFCKNGNEDVNDDGLLDVVCHFYTQDTGFQVGDTKGILKGMTQGGLTFWGEDSVRILK